MLNKQIETQFPVLELLQQRWSPRSFADRPVEPDKLGSLLQAAALAPSAYNEQPWRFAVGQRRADGQADETYRRLFECLREGNKVWAVQAPVLILTAAKRYLDHKGPEQPYVHGVYDTGAAVMCLVLQAQSLGLYCHQMAGFCPTRARELLNIPPHFDPLSVTAVGYLGEPAGLPETLRQREFAARTRRPLAELLIGSDWRP